MSFSVEGKQCKVCKAYLFDEDDVVFCPVCGAPHHRDCYNSLGHCALEELHGTENQYDSSKDGTIKKEEEQPKQEHTQKTASTINVKCNNCGEVFDASMNFCPKCGTENRIKLNSRFVNFDFLGGVPSDFDMGDGVTADEVKRFVFANSQRFVPKFANMKQGKKASFNLLAFLFPCAWFFSRKMYSLGAFFGALQVAFASMTLPLAKQILTSVPDEVKTGYLQLATYMTDNMSSFNKTLIIIAGLSGFLLLALMFISGIFGDYIYRNHALKTIKDIKDNSEDIDEDMHRKGGVSLLLMILGLLLTEYLPSIIAMLAGV